MMAIKKNTKFVIGQTLSFSHSKKTNYKMYFRCASPPLAKQHFFLQDNSLHIGKLTAERTCEISELATQLHCKVNSVFTGAFLAALKPQIP